MSRSSALIILGIIGMLVPFSGFPISARSFATVILGISVVGIGISLRTRTTSIAASVPVPIPEPPHDPSPI